MSEREWRVLGLVSVVSLFEQYDLFLFSLNLSQIQASFGVSDADVGYWASAVKFGAIPALAIALYADRSGRRRMLLLTVVAYTVFTGLTAFAPSMGTYVVCQFFARLFATAETLLAVVVIAEEFAAERRGWGIGALGAITACGGGLAALVYAFVDHLPYGWRSMYLVGIVPLALIGWFRRSLSETSHFLSHAADAPPISLRSGTLSGTASNLTMLLAVAFFLGATIATAVFFAPKFLREAHGWSPAAISALTFGGGAFAIVANPLAGYLSDRFGRRRMFVLFLCGYAAAVALFYGSAAALAPLGWTLVIFSMFGAMIMLQAYGTELFPTRGRATASSLRTITYDLGGVVGLALVSALYPATGSPFTSTLFLGVVALAAALIVAARFPETAGRSLNELETR